MCMTQIISKKLKSSMKSVGRNCNRLLRQSDGDPVRPTLGKIYPNPKIYIELCWQIG